MRAFSSAGCASCGVTTAASAASRAPASGAPSAASIPPSRSIDEITGALFPAQSFTSTENTYRSPPRLCTYPESAVTRSSVPVFARNRPAASVPSMRSRMVPSRAAIPSEETNSEATGNRFQTAWSNVAICLAVKRLVSFSPLPFFSTYVPRGIPSSASRSSATSSPLGHDPGIPFSSAPSVFTSISAMKFEDALFMSWMISASSGDS